MKVNFGKHIKHTHTQVTNYFCNQCDKTLFTCGNFETHKIKIHKKIHTLYEAFDCPTCTLSYKQSGFLKSHIGRHID